MTPRKSTNNKCKKVVGDGTDLSRVRKDGRKKGPLVRMPTSTKKFQDKTQVTRFERVTQFRPVVPGTIVKFSDLEGMPIFKWLEDVGLANLCTLSEPIYPELVKYFYNNWSEKTTPRGLVVNTYVKGISFSVDASTIREALGFGDIVEGDEHLYARFCNLKSNTVVGEWQFSKCFPLFCKNENVGSLNPYIRVLHKIVVTCLFSRTGCETRVTVKDACILWHILTKRKIDIAYAIFQSMRNIARSGGRKALSYGMIITRLLRQNLVSFDQEFVKNDVVYIDHLRVKFMGCVFNDGKWTTDNIPCVSLDSFPLVEGGKEPMNLEDPLLGATLPSNIDDVGHIMEDEDTESEHAAIEPENYHETCGRPFVNDISEQSSNRVVHLSDLEALKDHLTRQIEELKETILSVITKNGGP